MIFVYYLAVVGTITHVALGILAYKYFKYKKGKTK